MWSFYKFSNVVWHMNVQGQFLEGGDNLIALKKVCAMKV